MQLKIISLNEFNVVMYNFWSNRMVDYFAMQNSHDYLAD